MTSEPLPHDAGRMRRWCARRRSVAARLVDIARTAAQPSRFARWRDAVVCKLADSIDEQRTLWSLREATRATAAVPVEPGTRPARGALDRIVAAAQRHHGWWLAGRPRPVHRLGRPLLRAGPEHRRLLPRVPALRTPAVVAWRAARGVGCMDAAAERRTRRTCTLVQEPQAARAARVEAIAGGSVSSTFRRSSSGKRPETCVLYSRRIPLNSQRIS